MGFPGPVDRGATCILVGGSGQIWVFIAARSCGHGREAGWGDRPAIREQLAPIVEHDDAVAQQAPALTGLVGDHPRCHAIRCRSIRAPRLMLALHPALKALARGSAVPVKLEHGAHARLPERVEVAAYFVVSEALANAAKHAQASAVRVAVQARDGTLEIVIGDDGIGGADPSRGSGLIGLTDRIEALGGTIDVSSPADAGTQILVELPVKDPASAS